MRRGAVIGVGVSAVALLLIAVAFFLGSRQAMAGMSIMRVTPAEIANAMAGDSFYSDYNERTLLVQGTVASLSSEDGHLIVGLATNSSFRALCDLGSQPPNTRVGAQITVVAEGANAERETSAVLLTGCAVP